MVLALVDVAYRYPQGPRALRDVSLSVDSGELICLLGPNGAGKSTLVRAAAGLLPLDAGRVELAGSVASGLDSRERARRVAVVPQALDRVPDLTVADFALGGRYPHRGRFERMGGRDREVVRDSLALADAQGLEARLLSELSGGQRQRVLIARALAQEAPIVLVDEPTSSLDPAHQLAIFEVLAQQAASGRAVLVVTHDMNLASQFAHRLVLMDDGALAASGTAAEVLRPEVLAPVYGERLRFGSWPSPGGAGERPFVLPWADR